MNFKNFEKINKTGLIEIESIYPEDFEDEILKLKKTFEKYVEENKLPKEAVKFRFKMTNIGKKCLKISCKF